MTGDNIIGLRYEIEKLFETVTHSDRAYFDDEDGRNTFITYSMWADGDDPETISKLCMALYGTFVALRIPPACVKPLGCLPASLSPGKGVHRARLYWRSLPVLHRSQMPSGVKCEVECRAIVK